MKGDAGRPNPGGAGSPGAAPEPEPAAGGVAASDACPPSAAGHIEPYAARIALGPLPAGFAAGSFLEDLLEQVAAGCEEEGATLIGHLKCVFITEAGRVRCNLTSLRSGATCVEESAVESATAAPERAAPGGAAIDLAVLVYGLPAATIDRLVGEALATLLGPAGVDWGKHAEFRGHQELL